jgi:hypothetical protein
VLSISLFKKRRVIKPFALVVGVALSLLSGACLAQTPQPATALIEASIANADANAKEAFSYTFHEDVANFVANITGEPPKPTLSGSQWGITPFLAGPEYRWSVQYDVLFVEGVPYRRVTGINGQRLSPEIAAWESEHYDRAVAAIHSLSAEQRQRWLSAPGGFTSIMTDPKELISFYSCGITGHQEVEGRPATVVKCEPRQDLQQTNSATRMSGPVTLWVDDQQPFFHRTRIVVDHTVGQYGAGTVLIFNWGLIDGVWHQTSTELDWIGAEKIMRNVNAPMPGLPVTYVEQVSHGKVVDTLSDFKKFRIKSRILMPGSPSAVPVQPQP